MYLTPDQAAGMICPVRHGQRDRDAKCISTNCMAWRHTEHGGYCGLAGDPEGNRALDELAGELRVYNHFNHGR